MKMIGKVVKGSGRGRIMGFPTANLDIFVAEDEGIYAGWANALPALVFVGAAETFGETEKRVEVYILDFAGDLYGQELAVEIGKKLRDNIRFSTQEDLVKQMRRDENLAREFFKKQRS